MLNFLQIALLTIILIGGIHNSNANENPTNKELSVGDEAPDWTLTGTDDKEYKLSDFKGKKGVVVVWYPAALTGG